MLLLLVLLPLFAQKLPPDLPGLQWQDKVGLKPPSGLPPPRKTFIVLFPPNCPSVDKEGMLQFWSQLDTSFPHLLWTADCDMMSAGMLCKRALLNKWLDFNGPQILSWHHINSTWVPLKAANKDMTDFAAVVHKTHKQYMLLLSHQHEEDKLNLIRAVRLREDGDTKAQQGQVLVMTSQLPVWFNCTKYSLRPGGIGGAGRQMHPMSYAVQDFFSFMSYHEQYRGMPWILHWRISTHSKKSFQWTTGDRKLWRTVVAKKPSPLPQQQVDSVKIDGAQRRCKLVWGTHAEDITEHEISADGNMISVLGQKRTRLEVAVDTGRAYDWFRFRFLEFVNTVASRMRVLYAADPVLGEDGAVVKEQRPLVVYDPVAGSCWFPMLIQAALKNERVVRAICSDISMTAIDVARHDFATNGILEKDGNVHFFVGDLFDPLRKAIEFDSSLRPNIVYFLPPHQKKPENFNEEMSVTMNVPRESVFVPEGVEDSFYFFHRLAKEMPLLIADDAVVFISVAHVHTEEVLALLKSYDWPEPVERLGRFVDDHHLFYNPSGLIEYNFLGHLRR